MLRLFKKIFKRKRSASKKEKIRPKGFPKKKNPPKPKKKTKIQKPKKIPLKAKKISPLPKEKEVGVVTHYFNKISVGAIKLKASLRKGDKIHIKGAHDDFVQVVESMQLNHKDIDLASRGKEIGIKVAQRVHKHDKVYKVEE